MRPLFLLLGSVLLLGCGSRGQTMKTYAGDVPLRISFRTPAPVCVLNIMPVGTLESDNWVLDSAGSNTFQFKVKAAHYTVAYRSCRGQWYFESRVSDVDVTSARELVVVAPGEQTPPPSPGFEQTVVALSDGGHTDCLPRGTTCSKGAGKSAYAATPCCPGLSCGASGVCM